MRKNVAGQFVGAQMINATTGAAFTSTVTVYVTGDAGTQALGSVGSGVCTHEGNGLHSYAPATAETNYDHVAFTFIGTGAIPVTVQIYTTFPQTGDNFARLGAPAGASVSADIAAIEAQTDDIGAAGAGLTAVPWNAAWDAEVQSEASDALIAFAPPTLAELVTEINSVQTDIAALAVYVDTEVAAIKAKTDNLPTDPADQSLIIAATDAIVTAVGTRASQTSVDDLPTNAELVTALAAADDAVLAAVAGVQSDTNDIQARLPDALVGGFIKANIRSVNDVVIEGDGAATPWGPA